MQNIFKKIVSLFFCISILISVMCVPASAADDSSIMQDFWEWNVQTSRDAVDVFWKAIYGDSWMEDENGNWTGASRAELIEKYGQYTDGLQTDLGTTVLSDGSIRYYFTSTGVYRANGSAEIPCTLGQITTINNWLVPSAAERIQVTHAVKGHAEQITAPTDGTYSTGVIAPGLSIDTVFVENRNVTSGMVLNPAMNGTYVSSSLYFWLNDRKDEFFATSIIAYADFTPLSDISSLTSLDVSASSRPSSIVGDYGILGDDGTIIAVDKTIVDEGHSIVYNPVTNTTYNYTDYAYDYSDRSYNLTLEDGSTMKVVYGDENVTIQEGDTVYNVYYLTSGSEGGSGSDGSGDNGSGGIGGAIGGLFDVLGEIIYGLIEGTINLATKALSALTGLLDLLKQFGESIISFFGGYTDFLGAVFPFLPEETFTILNLGLILMIAAAVFKKFL